MGQIRQGSATTTRALRSKKQRSQASRAQLGQEFVINPKPMRSDASELQLMI